MYLNRLLQTTETEAYVFLANPIVQLGTHDCMQNVLFKHQMKTMSKEPIRRIHWYKSCSATPLSSPPIVSDIETDPVLGTIWIHEVLTAEHSQKQRVCQLWWRSPAAEAWVSVGLEHPLEIDGTHLFLSISASSTPGWVTASTFKKYKGTGTFKDLNIITNE
jgi:hypothetical protein